MTRTKQHKKLLKSIELEGKTMKTRTKLATKFAHKNTIPSTSRVSKARYLRGTVRNHVRSFKRSTDLLIPKLPFKRFIRELLQDINIDMMADSTAVVALQEAGEAFLIGIFEDTVVSAAHAKRDLIMPKDVKLAQRVRRIEEMIPLSDVGEEGNNTY